MADVEDVEDIFRNKGEAHPEQSVNPCSLSGNIWQDISELQRC